MAERQIIINRKLPRETRIQNSIIWDENLSPMARFSLIAMLSLPDSWDYSVRGMAAKLGISKDTMSKYMRELEKAGYLKRAQSHGENGAFSRAVYILTDTPWDFGEEKASDPGEDPCIENYDTAEACPDLSAPLESPQKKRTKEIHTPYSPPEKGKPEQTAQDQVFESFWKAYPRKVNKARARKVWDKLAPDPALCGVMGEALRRFRASPEWQKEGGAYIPHPATWLRNRRWEDDDLWNGGPDLSPEEPEPPRYGWD